MEGFRNPDHILYQVLPIGVYGDKTFFFGHMLLNIGKGGFHSRTLAPVDFVMQNRYPGEAAQLFKEGLAAGPAAVVYDEHGVPGFSRRESTTPRNFSSGW